MESPLHAISSFPHWLNCSVEDSLAYWRDRVAAPAFALGRRGATKAINAL